MKATTLALLAGCLLPAVPALADVDVKSIVAGAVENTFAGENYSWTSTLPRPDGTSVTVTGQTDHGTTWVTMKDGTTTRTMLIVSGKRFVLTSAGWKLAGLPAIQPGAEPPPSPPPESAGPRGGPESPEGRLRRAIDQVSTWTAEGDLFTGTFTGQAHGPGPRGPRPADAPPVPSGTETVTVSLHVLEGVLADCTLAMAGSFTDRSGETVTRQHAVATTFSAVGTTRIDVPADVSTLLTSAE